MSPKIAKKMFIVTGMSGAGKSQALKSFEDLGFYCVDNLPVALLENFAKWLLHRNDLQDVALGIDVREGKSLSEIPSLVNKMKKHDLNVRIIFLNAADNVLLHRFSETRHRHPLGKNLSSAITQERKMLREVKAAADKEIDTSGKTLGELKEEISRLLGLKRSQEMKLSVISFGYKHGIPMDADIVMDVRFLANPNYITALKNKTGLDKPVANYILKDPYLKNFFSSLMNLVSYLVPLYMKEGKSYLTIAIGCTGGHHRSVYIASSLARELKKTGLSVSEFHRDIKRP